MRRLFPLLVLMLVALLAGCGGGSKSGGGDAGGAVLSYFPKDALATTLVQTDPESGQIKAALELVRRFPGGDVLLGQAERSVESGGLDFGKDIKPLLGHPLAFGVLDADAEHVLFAWKVKDPVALERVIGKSGARKTGEYKGATLYKEPTSVDAVDGDLVVSASTEREVRDALDRHDDGSGLSADDLPANLPQDALVRGMGTLSAVLARPETAQARKVPWVEALKGYGFAVTADDSGVELVLRADTGGGDLDDADVPLATGDAAPRVADIGQLVVGLRDLNHVFDFALRAGGAVDPAGTTRFRANLQSIKGFAGVDLEHDLLGQLRSDATFTTDLGRSFALRATVRDAPRFLRSLTRLEKVLPFGLERTGIPGAKIRRAGPGLWIVSQSGSDVGAYGLVGDQFVAGNTTLGDLQALARRRADALEDAQGALAVRLPASALVRILSTQLSVPSGLGALGLRSLGDLHGSIAATAEGLRGSFRLDVR